MAFHEARLPARLAFGSTGGVERRTEITTLASGFERRSTPWADGRRRYLIGAGLRSLDDMAALTAFFEARRGRLYGFRVRDFADFKSCAPGEAVAATDQRIGTGDGTTTAFQLAKTYGDAGGSFRRVIAKPVAGSVLVAVDGVAADGATCDPVTGIVTFAPGFVPGSGAVVTAGFSFDVPVRFATDRIDINLQAFDAGRIPTIPLIEVMP